MTREVRGPHRPPARLLLVGLTLAAGCGVSPAPPATDQDAARPGRVVGALGRVEPAHGVVNVGSIPGEQVVDLLVQVGDDVAAGAPLARLAGDPLREVEYQAACRQRDETRERLEAQRRAAAATLVEAQLGVEQAAAAGLEIAAQEARVEATRQSAEVARQELARLSGLEQRLVPAQAFARKELVVRQAELELDVQRTALERTRQAADVGRRLAAARLESAQANLALVEAGSVVGLELAAEAARLRHEAALVRAPTAGRVIDVGMRVGEIVGPRPILRIADVTRMQVIAEVYESDVRRIRLGQPAEARSRAIDGPLTGRVVGIGTLVAPNDVQELGMPTTTERRVVDVRIDLDDPAAAAGLVHLQVDVDFLEAEGRPLRGRGGDDGISRGGEP